MNRETEILLFTESVEENIALELYNKAYSNLEKLNEKVDRYTIYLILVILLFFISSNLKIDTLQIGPVAVKNTSIVIIILPILYFAFIFNIMTMAMHKSELYFGVKKLGMKIFKCEYNLPNTHDIQSNFITRMFMPFSYSSFGKQMIIKNGEIGNAIFGLIVMSPALLMILAIFVIGFFMLRDLWILHYSTTLGKISFWVSIWIILFIFYMIKTWGKLLNGENLNF